MNRGTGAEAQAQSDPYKASHKLPWIVIKTETKEDVMQIRTNLIFKGLLIAPCVAAKVPVSLVET